MKKLLSFLFGLLVVMFILTGCSPDPVDTTGSIVGIIKDAVTGANIQGAEISIEGYGTKSTGADGRYQFDDVNQGTYKVSVNSANYNSDEKSATVRAGEKTTLDFSLTRASSSLEVSPIFLDFGTTDNYLSLDVKNTGQGTMRWEIIENFEWLTCTPTSGTIQAGSQNSITVSVNRSGLPKGNYDNTLIITSNDGGSKTIRFNMTVDGSDIGLPQIDMIDVGGVTNVSATFIGSLSSIGSSRVTDHGFCWDIKHNPSLSNGAAHESLGYSDTSKDRVTYSATGLSANTTYYVRAYAVNAQGPVYSDHEICFTTDDTPQMPIVQIGGYSNLTSNSVTVAGNILKLGDKKGILQHGHCWSDNTREPTVADNKTEKGNTKQTGSFNSELTNLKPNTLYYVRAYAVNQYGHGYSDDVVQFTTPPAEVKLRTKSVTERTHNEATCGGKITDLGGNTITERGVCWNISKSPTINNNHSASTDKTDEFSVRMTNLTPQATYYVRAYVKTSMGETYYGQEVVFTTPTEVFLPQVSTTTVKDVTAVSASISASVVDIGNGTVIDKGFCYSTSPNPTTDENKISCGGKTSPFSTTLSELSGNTRYYVRAYVTNERGTGYGEQVEFQTLPLNFPTLSNVTITGITFRSATFEASVESVGNGTLKRSGFCYGKSPNPTINNTVTSCDAKTTFKVTVSSLDAETTYHVRAFAENEKGIAYSEDKTFTTLDGSNVQLEGWDEDENWNF